MNNLDTYDKKSTKWNEFSGVRSDSETYDLNISKNQKNPKLSWHLKTYSGILTHSDLINLSDEKVEYVKGIQLLEFVLKQTVFEVDCVNYVASKIAHDKYKFKLTQKLKLDALKIYTDEGYHAYYTQKVAQQIANYYDVNTDDLQKYISDYYLKIDELVGRYGPEYKDLCMLAFVISGENQIVSDISEQMRGVVYEPIRNMFRNHMKDEVFHAHFFTQIFKEAWPQLNDIEKEYMGLTFLESMKILGLPRTDIYYYSLSKIGYSNEQISKYINDIYNTLEWKEVRIRDRMLPTIELLKNSNVFEIKSLKEKFVEKKYI
jgi:hypothetical protein